MKVRAMLAVAVLGLTVVPVQAETDADRAIEYRQGVFRAMEWNLTPMAAMVQGRAVFDVDEFQRRSARLVLLGGIVAEGFTDAQSARGEAVKTRASYRIWQQSGQFQQLMSDMQDRGRALQEAAASGTEPDDLRPLLGRLAQSCKACHDKFRD